ncbi:MAG: hypothetical protein OXE85_07265 [Roseovarius sp.]|nr:hypothetical protein [Roseovarius sp.]
MATRKAEHSLPAIATDVSLPMDVAREEIFEPIAAIIDLDTEDKASRFTTIRNTVLRTTSIPEIRVETTLAGRTKIRYVQR